MATDCSAEFSDSDADDEIDIVVADTAVIVESQIHGQSVLNENKCIIVRHGQRNFGRPITAFRF